jgi:hypothetical protein
MSSAVVRARIGLFLIVVAIVPLGGCSFLIQSIADPAAQQQVKRLKLPTSQAAAFSQCLQKAEGRCEKPDPLADKLAATPRLLDTKTSVPKIRLLDETGKRLPAAAVSDVMADGKRIASADLNLLRSGAPAADKARKVLNNPVQAQLNDIFNAARASRSDPTSDTPSKLGNRDIAINVQEFNDYLSQVEEATNADGWQALAREAPFSDAAPEDSIRRQYIAAYFNAYFRSGKFYSVTLNGAALEKKIAARLKDAVPGISADGSKDPYEALARKLFTELKFDETNQRFIGKIATDGFVTRGGQDLKFPAVEAELFLGGGKPQTSKIDYVAVGADLIRVLLHAVYDAHDRIPGVTNATGNALPRPLGKYDPEKGGVDANEFGEIESRAARMEATVSGGVGRIVRGLGFVALNNEALATAVETAVGVAARKHTEKVLWCWTACGLNASPTGDGQSSPMPDEEVSIGISITGEPASTLGVVKSK